MDVDSILSNINSTITSNRKSGIQNLLDAVKNFYNDTNLREASNSNYMENELGNLFSNPSKLDELFTSIGWLLRDSTDWQIQRDTVETLIAIITKDLLNDKLDFYMRQIFRHLISCFSASKMTVRKSANQCFHEYLKKTKDFEDCMLDFVELALHRDVPFPQRRDYNQTLLIVLTSNFSKHNFENLVRGILKQLEFNKNDDKLFNLVIDVLKHLRKMFGEEKLVNTVKKLPPNYQALFHDFCLSCLDSTNANSKTTTPSIVNGTDNGYNSSRGSLAFQTKSFSLQTPVQSARLFCGFIPESVMNNLLSDKKLEGTEELCNLYNKLSVDSTEDLISNHLTELLDIIQNLMEDKYNVIIKAFKLLIDLVTKLPSHIVDNKLELLLQLLHTALSINMHTDAIMQKLIANYSMLLFQKSDSKHLMVKLCDSNFVNDQKQPTIRLMSINIIISALLKFPSNKFDLNFLTTKISQRLLDKKAKVKQAALECMSVIGYNYGQAKLSTMMKCIEQSITNPELLDNVKEMTHNRLSMHKLPHVNEEGIVVYAVCDNINVNNSNCTSQRSQFQQQHRNSITDIDNSSSDNSPISSANLLEKRRPSAGMVRGRAKLPWDQVENSSTQKQTPYSKAPSNGNLNHNNIDPLPIQYSAAPLSTITKEMVNEGRNIRKFNEFTHNSSSTTNSNLDHYEKSSSRSNQNSLPSSRSDCIDPNNSIYTSGYASGSNTSRQYPNNISYNKPNSTRSDDCPTATNSTNVTPRNNISSTRYEDTTVADSNTNTTPNTVNDFSPIPTKPALGRSAGSRRKEFEANNKADSVENIVLSNRVEEQPVRLEQIRNSASKKKAQKIFNTSPNNSQNTSSSNITNNKPIKPTTNINSNVNTTPTSTSTGTKNPTFKPVLNYSGVIVGKSVSVEQTNETNTNTKKSRQPVKGLLDSNSPVPNEIKKSVTNTTAKPFNNTINNRPINNNSNIKSSKNDSIGIVGVGLSDKSLGITNYDDEIDLYSDDDDDDEDDVEDGDDDEETDDVEDYDDDSDKEPNKNLISNTLRQSMSLKKLKAANGSQKPKVESQLNRSISSTLPTNLTGSTKPTYNHTNGPAATITPISTQGAISHSAPGSGSHVASNRKPPVSMYHQSNYTPSSAGNDRDYDTVPPSRRPLKPAYGSSTPKKIKPTSQISNNSNPSTNAISTSDAQAAFVPSPLANPDKSISSCLNTIQNEDWEHKIEALNIIQNLALFHPETLSSRPTDLHSICIALCKEIKNLRSQVARTGIHTAGLLFKSLKKTMDSELELVVSSLFAKAGDPTSSFIRQDVENNLMIMIENVSCHKAIATLVQNGLDNKNPALRKLSAINLMQIGEKLGHVKFLNMIKEMNEKILLAVVKFAMDGNGETRYYARRIMAELMKNSDFEKVCNKHVPENDLRSLKNILEGLRTKGVGEPPQISHSAGLGRSGSLSRGGSAGNLVSMATVPSTSTGSKLSRGSSRSMTKLPGSTPGNTLPSTPSSSTTSNVISHNTDSSTEAWLNSTCSQLGSNDFRQRLAGLDSIQNELDTNDTSQSPLVVVGVHSKLLTRLLQILIPKLSDNNSKVTICALQTTKKLIPTICSTLPNEHLSRLINSISWNYASKSSELRDAAMTLMSICFEYLDQSLLVQPCIEAVNNANMKTKPILVENLCQLLQESQSSKPINSRIPGAILRYVLPFVNHLLEQNHKSLPNQLRPSVQQLLRLSHDIVGPDLLDHAVQRGGQTLKQNILDLLK